ncbi:hypothetical protein RRG08_007579 [Elysia crispata]|uniref:Uncharacterized protein n=1 Tax=Elysia crispata TaxID=231223 RepID=A0AAE1DAX3_9GAST|nr:hypothetical protein RRG08_007579 [Elysia crispata]
MGAASIMSFFTDCPPRLIAGILVFVTMSHVPMQLLKIKDKQKLKKNGEGVYLDHPQILSLPTPAPRRAESLVPSPLHYGLLLGVKLQLWAMTVKTTQSVN